MMIYDDHTFRYPPVILKPLKLSLTFTCVATVGGVEEENVHCLPNNTNICKIITILIVLS